jgi:hypothetical protein
MVVGHLPHLPDLARKLGGVDQFPLNGMVALERIDSRHYSECWRAQPPTDISLG